MSHPAIAGHLPAEFIVEMSVRLQQRLIDQLVKIDAPAPLLSLALCMSYFQSPDPSPADLPLFITQATSALIETGGL